VIAFGGAIGTCSALELAALAGRWGWLLSRRGAELAGAYVQGREAAAATAGYRPETAVQRSSARTSPRRRDRAPLDTVIRLRPTGCRGRAARVSSSRRRAALPRHASWRQSRRGRLSARAAGTAVSGRYPRGRRRGLAALDVRPRELEPRDATSQPPPTPRRGRELEARFDVPSRTPESYHDADPEGTFRPPAGWAGLFGRIDSLLMI